jgi:hypothetical protein
MRWIAGLLLMTLAATCSTRSGTEAGRSVDSPLETAAPIDPADQALCKRFCDLIATVGCADSGRCMDGCLGTFAPGTCLEERRALVNCQIDGGMASFSCIDGSTFEGAAYCNDALNVVGACLSRRNTAAGR